MNETKTPDPIAQLIRARFAAIGKRTRNFADSLDAFLVNERKRLIAGGLTSIEAYDVLHTSLSAKPLSELI